MEQEKTSLESSKKQINDISAINEMFFYIEMAQKRGSYSLEESAQIWEIFKYFKKKFDGPK